MNSKSVTIGGATLGGGEKPVLIAGPCVIESEELTLSTANSLKEIAERIGVDFIFKSSYDKANRTSVDSFRGPGLDAGLEVLSRVRREVGVPVITDVHTVEEAVAAAEVADSIQIPAFLSRQTDLLVAAGRTGKPVNIKKGQFLAPEDMENAVKKVESSGVCPGVTLTERGTTMGYRYLVVDFQGFARMKELGYPVVFDATHSVQSPGGGCGVSSGNREMAPVLARAAAAVGIDALFIEVHPDPDHALCDGPNSLHLSAVEPLMRMILAIDAARREG